MCRSLQAQLAEKDQDFTDLMVCLGQETAKVEALAALLQQRGVDAQALLDKVCFLCCSGLIHINLAH